MIKAEIGTHASQIWQLLFKTGSLSMRQIGELSGMTESMMNLALGWLARENKVHFVKKGNTMYCEPNNTASEMYYS